MLYWIDKKLVCDSFCILLFERLNILTVDVIQLKRIFFNILQSIVVIAVTMLYSHNTEILLFIKITG